MFVFSRGAVALIAFIAASAFSTPVIVNAQEDGANGIPFEWAPWKDPNDPDVLKLADDKDQLFVRRDVTKDPKREPGLINPQRYELGPMFGGMPTLLGAPLALNADDLTAGKVDVALVGLSIGDQMIPGGRFAAMTMRSLTDYLFTGAAGTDNATGVDYGKLVVADYGNVASNWMADNQVNLDEVHKVVSEILNAGAIPIGVGGTHVQSYGFFTALAKRYGPGEFAVLHVDAHYDAYSYGAGRFVHNGSFFRLAVEKGLINGGDVIQVGLRGSSPDAKSMEWLRGNKFKFHFQAEIEKDGWDAVLKKILEELKGKKVYITFDMDGVDPAFAPAVGTQEPSGLTAANAMQLVRAVGIQNEIIAAEFNEYNPLLDDRHQTTGILMDRLIRSLLGGIQGRREGIKDPLYYDPDRISHGSDGD